MKLIGTYFSPYVRRIAVALISRGLKFEHEPINAYRQFDAARQYNPIARVPSLVLEDGEVLIDSTAILDYLNELTPEAPLIPSGSLERRRALKLAAIGTGVFELTSILGFRGTEVAPSEADRWRAQIRGGLEALDSVAAQGGPLWAMPIDIAVITAVLTVEYLAQTSPNFDVVTAVPALTVFAVTHHDTEPFTLTRPA